jgi:hypothetical protein
LTIYDIARNIMTPNRLKKLKLELKELRRSPQGRSSADFVRLAEALGRELWKRGSEPNYVRKKDPALAPPLSIPWHPKDMPIGTARSIIDQLLSDCDDWEIYFLQQADDHDD